MFTLSSQVFMAVTNSLKRASHGVLTDVDRTLRRLHEVPAAKAISFQCLWFSPDGEHTYFQTGVHCLRTNIADADLVDWLDQLLVQMKNKLALGEPLFLSEATTKKN